MPIKSSKKHINATFNSHIHAFPSVQLLFIIFALMFSFSTILLARMKAAFIPSEFCNYISYFLFYTSLFHSVCAFPSFFINSLWVGKVFISLRLSKNLFLNSWFNFCDLVKCLVSFSTTLYSLSLQPHQRIRILQSNLLASCPS